MSISFWQPETASELSQLVKDQFAAGQQPLLPVGGGTLLHWGSPVMPEPITVSTQGLNRIVDYPARDMTITVESGVTLAALQEQLGQAGQRLPIDVPLPGQATIGGAIAADVSGPSRFGYGTFRDYVIGVSAVDGQGRLFSSGGRVVKNVAGYDLCKLLIGSLGTLAIITQVTLKVRPQAESRSLVVAGVRRPADLEPLLTALNTSCTRPVIVDVLAQRLLPGGTVGDWSSEVPDCSYLLCVAFEGSRSEVDWQTDAVQAELQSAESVVAISPDSVPRVWELLCDLPHDRSSPLTFTASLLPSRVVSFLEQASAQDVLVQAHAGNGIVVGHLPERCRQAGAALEIVRPLRHAAKSCGGSLTVTSCDDGWKQEIDIFGPLPDSWRLCSGLKSALDPRGLLAPGRFGRDCNFEERKHGTPH